MEESHLSTSVEILLTMLAQGLRGCGHTRENVYLLTGLSLAALLLDLEDMDLIQAAFECQPAVLSLTDQAKQAER